MSSGEKAINLLQSADIDKETGDVQWHTWYKGIDKDVKKAFDKNKITIPFPQLDVHLDK
jgi:small-conductance mechanosensitive channel